MREAASAALAEAGHAEDPRLRGAGHKIASAISQFLRSPLAEKPFLKSGQADRPPPGGAPAELVLCRDAGIDAEPPDGSGPALPSGWAITWPNLRPRRLS